MVVERSEFCGKGLPFQKDSFNARGKMERRKDGFSCGGRAPVDSEQAHERGKCRDGEERNCKDKTADGSGSLATRFPREEKHSCFGFLLWSMRGTICEREKLHMLHLNLLSVERTGPLSIAIVVVFVLSKNTIY